MSDSINERVRALRKSLKLNQTEFGQRIGLKTSAVSKMEQDGSTVIDQNIRLICQTFHVSERWLRTGAGPMENDDTDTVLSRLREEMSLTDLETRLLQTYLSFPAEERQLFLELTGRFAARFAHDEEPDGDADEAARLHAQLDAELQAEREAASASSATSSEKKA